MDAIGPQVSCTRGQATAACQHTSPPTAVALASGAGGAEKKRCWWVLAAGPIAPIAPTVKPQPKQRQWGPTHRPAAMTHEAEPPAHAPGALKACGAAWRLALCPVVGPLPRFPPAGTKPHGTAPPYSPLVKRVQVGVRTPIGLGCHCTRSWRADRPRRAGLG